MGEFNCNANAIEVYVELAGKERFHSSLLGRDEDNQHPISAITDLQDKLDELAILNNTYTKDEIDAKVQGSLIYKGDVTDYESLPLVDNKIGDVYNVVSTGNNYVWTGKGWDNLSGTGNGSSDFATKDYVDGSVNNAVNIITDHMDEHFYNKDEIDEMLSGTPNANNLFCYKGEVDTFQQLPEDNKKIGYVYTIKDTGHQYFWDGFDWQLIGVDTYTRFEIDNKITDSTSKVFNELVSFKNEVTENINNLNTEVSNSVKYSLWDNRKFIQLDNHDALSGVMTDGEGANLIMMSKWDVVDIGSTKAHMNLNTKEVVTINDTKIVATTEDIVNAVSTKADKDSVYTKDEIDARLNSIFTYKGSVPTEAELPVNGNVGDTYNVEQTGANYAWNGTAWDKLSETIDLSGYIKSEELGQILDKELEDVVEYSHFETDGVSRKAIQLNNYDSLSGISTNGEGHNLAMVSKYDVADFGSPKLHTNINTSQIVTINDTQAVLTDELLEIILASGKNIQIEKNQLTDPSTGFKFYQYNLSIDLDGLATTEQLNELAQQKQDVGNYVEVSEDGSTKIGNAITVNPDNTIVIKMGNEDIVLQEVLSNTSSDANIELINQRLATLEDVKADKADFYSKQEIDEKDIYNVKWQLFTNADGDSEKRAFIDNDVVITDKLLQQVILPGNNVTVETKTIVDAVTSLPINTYEISTNLDNYYTKPEVDEISKELQASIDAVEEASAKQWLSMSDVINSTNI